MASEHDGDVFPFLHCKVPFLNGGLFEPMNGYNWRETDIRIDNDIIAGVLDTFDQYNFTVREDEPLEKEVAVDPEMLGKVFENLLPENLRKGKGAYYTPRTIVHYMCQESLINYLDTSVNEPPKSYQEIGNVQLDAMGNKSVKNQLRLEAEHRDKPLVPKEDIETLIREGERVLEYEVKRAEEFANDKYYKGKYSKPAISIKLEECAQELDDALANIKVCDPAIGSGAFPVGMLTEIVKARTVLSLYLDMESIDCVEGALTQSMQSKNRTIYNLKRHCIQNSLYGVDIDPGAIEIAKLRLWLSLVVDEDDYTTIQPLPNLDYKIMQGNSLIEEFHGISLDIEKKNEQQGLFSGGSELDKLVDDLHQKQDEFFNAEHPREKQKKREAVETAIYNIFHNELEKKKSISSVEANEIEADLKEMTHGNKERNFFPWKLYFADVFRLKGGFDVVIGNPPYVSAVKHVKTNKIDRDYYRMVYSELKGSFDLYTVFLLKTTNIVNLVGTYSWIIPNGFLVSDYSKSVIEKMKQYGFYRTIDVSKYNVFHDIGVYPIIVLGKIGEKNYNDFLINDIDDLKYNKLIKKKDLFSFKTFIDFEIKIASGTTGFQAGQIKELILNEPQKTNNSIPFAVSGAVDPYVVQTERVRYMGDTYFKPHILKNLNIVANSKWEFWCREKIVIAGMTKRIEAVYIDSPLALGVGIYGIYNFSGFKPKFLLAILNSKFLTFYLNYKFKDKHLAGGYLAINKSTIEKLPLVEANDNQQGELSNLAGQILTAKKANPQADTTALEAEIDQLVYELYGLTEEEIAIVEKSTS